MAKYIKDVFGLWCIGSNFLKDLGHLSNVDKFYKSLVYFANGEYYIKYLKQQKSKEMIDIIMNKPKQIKIIKELVQLFWKNGLINDDTINVYTGKDKLSDKHKKFISKYEKEMRLIFSSVKRLVKPKNPYQLICLLDKILKEFFGGFVCLDISDLHRIQKNKQQLKYYYVRINVKRYIELVLVKNVKLLDDHIDIIKTLFGNTKCSYTDIHNYEEIKDIIDSNSKVKSMFVDDELLEDDLNFSENESDDDLDI